MKISDLLNLTAPDIQSWTAEDYRAALKPLRAEAGKRVANLRKSGTIETSPAAEWYQRNLKNIAKMKSENEIEYVQATFVVSSINYKEMII